ncbi:MAG: nitroreductase family protein [Gemmatimonadota bacterium]
MTTDPGFVELSFQEYDVAEMRARAAETYAELDRRRSVRQFDTRPVPAQIIEDCIRAAGTAPSGAHQQPWHFAAVSDPALKTRIRAAAEQEEQSFYGGRAPQEWLDVLAPLGTDDNKPFLETAPWLIAIFARSYGIDPSGQHVKHYYVQESVGIATGLLVSAVHRAGLASLTHTPSPMGFLNEILERPKNERPYLLLVVGYPAPGALVPDLKRKDLSEIASFH